MNHGFPRFLRALGHFDHAIWPSAARAPWQRRNGLVLPSDMKCRQPRGATPVFHKWRQ